jgi:hypothetical protein
MKLNSDLTINGTLYRAGDSVSAWSIYPFFLLHMGLFGLSGFFLAYGHDTSLGFLYLHGGIAITVYVLFYLAIFGRDAVKWMFINAALGLFGIYSQIDRILSWFGKRLADYPVAVNVTPFLYYILYTFLLRQALLDLTGSRENPRRRRVVESAYVVGSLAIYGALSLSK